MVGLIYLIRNTVNGKVYVGQTHQGLARRKAEHLSRDKRGDRDHKLYLAMKKHGADAFVFEEFCSAVKPELLDALEIDVISQFNSYGRGYNMTPGGGAPSAEKRAHMSRLFTGRKNHWVTSESVKAMYADGRRRPSKQKEGALHWRAAQYIVGCPDNTIRRIHGLKAFCRDNNLTFKAMCDTLAGKQTHHKGFALFAKLPISQPCQVAA